MNKEWNVLVDCVGHIGTVHETSEEAALCAALSKFHEDGDRCAAKKRLVIYEGDVFSVNQK
jgi:hypothetical protein